MGKVYAFIWDYGSHSDRDWEIVAVCSSAEAAFERMCAALVEGFVNEKHGPCDFEDYPSPYYIEAWNLDGERGSEDEGEEICRRARVAARRHPEVQTTMDARAAVCEANAAEKRRMAEAGTKYARRQLLDAQVLTGGMTVKEYRRKVEELDQAYGQRTD